MQDVLEIGNSLPLAITGEYAVQAYQLDADNVHYVKLAVERPFPVAWRWSWEEIRKPCHGHLADLLVASETGH